MILFGFRVFVAYATLRFLTALPTPSTKILKTLLAPHKTQDYSEQSQKRNIDKPQKRGFENTKPTPN